MPAILIAILPQDVGWRRGHDSQVAGIAPALCENSALATIRSSPHENQQAVSNISSRQHEYETGIWKVGKIQHTQPGKGGPICRSWK
jgi:hypothetical protein